MDVKAGTSWRYNALGVDAEIRYGIFYELALDATNWATVVDPWMVTYVESSDALPTTGAKTAIGAE